MRILGARGWRTLSVFAVSVAMSLPMAGAVSGEPATVARAEAAAAPAVATAAPMLPSGPGTDPVEGEVLPPAAGAAGVEKRIADMEARSAEATTRPLPNTYRKATYVPRALSWSQLPYNSPTVYDPSVPRDASGVRLYRSPADGKLYNHPVLQAQDALTSLSNYRLTNAQRFLTRAVADAQRIIDRRVVSDEAWYFPYPFDFALHGGSTVMRAPWFSAMAQGQALSAFVRLHQITGQQRWRDAADVTFNSFRNAPVQGLPSTVHIDGSNYLWLEEYPRWPTSSSDLTFNGHVFAIFGLYDYFRLTGDPLALDMWNGALANALPRVQNNIRNPGYISSYCLQHPAILSASYHDVHWHQVLSLHASTGDSVWSRIADALRADYPPPAVSGTVVFVGGKHTGYKFTKNGAVTASKSITLNRRSAAPGDQRARIKGRGIYLRITAGSLAGYWVTENYLRTWFAGAKAPLVYPLSRTVRIPAGAWSAYKFNSAGTVTAAKTIRPWRETSAPFRRSATINGRMHILITAGSLTGYWLPTRQMILV